MNIQIDISIPNGLRGRKKNGVDTIHNAIPQDCFTSSQIRLSFKLSSIREGLHKLWHAGRGRYLAKRNLTHLTTNLILFTAEKWFDRLGCLMSRSTTRFV